MSFTLNIPEVTGTVAVGPSSTTDGDLVSYNGTSGIIKDSGISSSSIAQKSGSFTIGNLAAFNSSGQIVDSGISYQTTGDQSATYTGIWATGQACTIRADRIGSVVTVSGTELLAGANTSARISCSFSLPSAYIPTVCNSTALYTVPIIVYDNSAWIMGTVNISNGGAITITNATDLAASGNFSGVGNSGTTAWSITYNLQ